MGTITRSKDGKVAVFYDKSGLSEDDIALLKVTCKVFCRLVPLGQVMELHLFADEINIDHNKNGHFDRHVWVLNRAALLTSFTINFSLPLNDVVFSRRRIVKAVNYESAIDEIIRLEHNRPITNYNVVAVSSSFKVGRYTFESSNLLSGIDTDDN